VEASKEISYRHKEVLGGRSIEMEVTQQVGCNWMKNCNKGNAIGSCVVWAMTWLIKIL
jgi:hypothetical protein